MRVLQGALATVILVLAPLALGAQEPSDPSRDDDDAACQPWDHGAAAREHGWRVSELEGAERSAVIRYYDEAVAPRADPKSDTVVVASHPELPIVRVIIARGDCIVDIGQMGADVLAQILRKAGMRA